MRSLKKFAFLLIILSLLSGVVSAQESQFLEVWDQWEFYGMTAAGPALEVIHAAWNEAHPSVFLDRSVFGGGWPIRNAIELGLTSGDAPDVF